MRLSLAAPLAVAAASLTLVACGSDSSSSSDADTSSKDDTAVALKEVAATRDALRQAAATYRSGDEAAAGEQVSEAYVEHFEEVEHPLEAKDAELKERLEEAIATELRDQIKAGRSPSEIQAKVDAIVADLDKAESTLR
jgi:hypothetical protein